MKKLYDYLKINYKNDQPILLSEIKIPGRTEESIRKAMERLVSSNLVNRFSNGVYYIPIKTMLGNKELSPTDVITAKYIKNNENTYGFYTGISFANAIGITTQIPNTVEVVSNKEASAKRAVKIGYQTIIVRKSPVEITADNMKLIQLLDYIRREKTIVLKDNAVNFRQYVKDNKFKKSELNQILSQLPLKVMNKIRESGIENAFT